MWGTIRCTENNLTDADRLFIPAKPNPWRFRSARSVSPCLPRACIGGDENYAIVGPGASAATDVPPPNTNTRNENNNIDNKQ